MSNRALKIKIYGYVQEVGFRVYVKNAADKLNLRGYVKNQDDGSVYIFAQGMNDDLVQFVKLCKKGPQFANINKMEIEEVSNKKLEQGFDIRI